jgi:hypothetical protein
MVIIGIILLYFGYFLLFGHFSPLFPYLLWTRKKTLLNEPDKMKVCPLCSMGMLKGELVQTTAFPTSTSGIGTDRLMHIKGCVGCLKNNLPRKCPVCGKKLSITDYLVSRMFERRHHKNHVHVLGCSVCRKPKSLDR